MEKIKRMLKQEQSVNLMTCDIVMMDVLFVAELADQGDFIHARRILELEKVHKHVRTPASVAHIQAEEDSPTRGCSS